MPHGAVMYIANSRMTFDLPNRKNAVGGSKVTCELRQVRNEPCVTEVFFRPQVVFIVLGQQITVFFPSRE